jgi:hypothetical protein
MKPLLPKRDTILYALVIPGISVISCTADKNRNWCIHKSKEYFRQYPRCTLSMDTPWQVFVEKSKSLFGKTVVIAEYELTEKQTCPSKT